jgi:hypothetical protein
MGIDGLAMVLYVSDDSQACERAVTNLRAAADRLRIAATWELRNVSAGPLDDDERALIVLTPMLVVKEPTRVRIAAELDDLDALEQRLLALVRRARGRPVPPRRCRSLTLS